MALIPQSSCAGGFATHFARQTTPSKLPRVPLQLASRTRLSPFAAMKKSQVSPTKEGSLVSSNEAHTLDAPLNVSGHKQELERNFGLLSVCSLGITSGNTWIALGGTVTVAIYNGGPPGMIYEFIAASVFYWLIAASIAELASAIPSSGGVYHWATITAGRFGRSCGWFAGWWNCLAWLFGIASTLQIVAAQTTSMYAVFHPGFETQKWHVFVSYIITTWICCFIVLFMNRALPSIETLGGFFVVAGVFVTIVVCAVMPHVNHIPYSSTASIWTDWENATGYSSSGFAFLLGMLNGAFSVGTPDLTTHLAEEIPRQATPSTSNKTSQAVEILVNHKNRPSMNIPKAILAQFVFGFLSGFLYLISILYGITSLDDILGSPYLFPLAEIYRQAAGTRSGAVGLLVLAFVPTFISCIGCYITASRVFWTLARDNATPFSRFFACVSQQQHNPFRAIVFCAAFCTIMGCIYLGSSTAFSAFVGSFVVLSTLSYLLAILPHLLSGRRLITPGWFWMKGTWGFAVNSVSCVYIALFVVIFCFPFSMPVEASSMNYASLITGGLTIFVAAFWFWRQEDYVGPKSVILDESILAKDAL